MFLKDSNEPNIPMHKFYPQTMNALTQNFDRMFSSIRPGIVLNQSQIPITLSQYVTQWSVIGCQGTTQGEQ